MDPAEMLVVRFHYRGEFDFDGNPVNYVGGQVGLSNIERDKLSLPELRGYLSDHVTLSDEHNVDFHWLFPEAELSSGLRRLHTDEKCLHMSECISEGGVAEVYVEIYKYDEANNQVFMWSSVDTSDMWKVNSVGMNTHQGTTESVGHAGDSESEDEDYEDTSEGEESVEGDEDTSKDDEEATGFRETARNMRKQLATMTAKVTMTTVVVPENVEDGLVHVVDEPPMMKSSEEASYEDDDGEATRRTSGEVHLLDVEH